MLRAFMFMLENSLSTETGETVVSWQLFPRVSTQSFIHLANQFIQSYIETLIAMTTDLFCLRNESLESFQLLLDV